MDRVRKTRDQVVGRSARVRPKLPHWFHFQPGLRSGSMTAIHVAEAVGWRVVLGRGKWVPDAEAIRVPRVGDEWGSDQTSPVRLETRELSVAEDVAGQTSTA